MVFHYTARNPEGRRLRGSVEALTQSDALTILRTRAIVVTTLECSATLKGAIASAIGWMPVSHQAIVTLFRSLATLTRAGVPLRRGLTICAQECRDRRLRETLEAVGADVESGLSLSEAMVRRPKDFSKLAVAMIEAGERGGVLDEVLERLAHMCERDREVRKKVRAALTYPAIVAITAAGVLLLLLTAVVPVFRAMYQQLGVTVPPMLHLLIALSSALRSPASWFGGAVLGAGLVTFAIIYSRSAAGMQRLGALRLHIPLVGSVLRKAEIARLARMLGTLLSCGVNLHQALPVVSAIASGHEFAQSVDALGRSISDGSSIAQPLRASGLYDEIFLQLVRVGEETGRLDAMLLKIASYYELDVETALQTLGTALEPVLIVLLGGAVAFVAAAIFVPLYTLIGNIK
ncbi:MAG TPA: type II secretion system F family protein [Candidatus Rubrimentiphilum sp.]|nr:type II secretion system F family protein [Candidatus Rubrimentiphilum sp.]